jgi:hypothetical protein
MEERRVGGNGEEIPIAPPPERVGRKVASLLYILSLVANIAAWLGTGALVSGTSLSVIDATCNTKGINSVRAVMSKTTISELSRLFHC